LWERIEGIAAVPLNEGNEVMRDGQQGVGVSHMTDEIGEPPQRDPVEERGRRDMELPEGKMEETPFSEPISTKLRRIALLAREDLERSFLSLAHHIDVEFLREAFRRTRKDGAPGVDGRTASEYGRDLDVHLPLLLKRFKDGDYKAPPVRRAHIPKGDGKKTRPIGIPTIEDKVLQRAVTMVLEAVYEPLFSNSSYGFRPGRSARQAVQDLWSTLMKFRGGWVIEADIESFFDSLSHQKLRSILDQRVRDGVLRRTIDKWLKAGVMDGVQRSYPHSGTPQGGVVSPVLANIYLHTVLDDWFEKDIVPRLKGEAHLIRYADDFVMVFREGQDAHLLFDLLRERFAEFDLKLHPDKTRLLHFRPPTSGPSSKNRDEPRSFDFLGFSHHWARSRKGAWVVKQQTARTRFTRSLRRISDWCRRNRHLPVVDQHRHLTRQLRGHDAYFGIPGNYRALERLRYYVARIWRRSLDRRSQRARMHWDRFQRLLARYPLPRSKLHPVSGPA
jgi:RNA-directed DNA polymerase